jgi:hypothetical protein
MEVIRLSTGDVAMVCNEEELAYFYHKCNMADDDTWDNYKEEEEINPLSSYTYWNAIRKEHIANGKL